MPGWHENVRAYQKIRSGTKNKKKLGWKKFRLHRDYIPIDFMDAIIFFAQKLKTILKNRKVIFMHNFNMADALEFSVVLSYLANNPGVYNLGLELASYTGLRVGELSTLKFEDYCKKSLRRSGETMHMLSI